MNIYREKQALGFWAFILLAAPLMGRTQEWRQERMQKIEDSKSLPHEERVPILGSIVTAGYPDRMMPPNEIQLEVAAKARAEMLLIPGHAEYYRNQPEGAADATAAELGATPASGSSAALPVLIAAGMVILAALWYFLRVRKGRTA